MDERVTRPNSFETMTPPADQTLGCPACGMKLTGRETQCPRCGKKFDGGSRFECPFCGEQILVGSQRCPVCKMSLSGLTDMVKPQTVENTMAELMDDLIELEADQVKSENKKFCCPKCSLLLDGSEPKCPKCGQALTGKNGLQCPICGTMVDKAMTVCPKCGISLAKVAEQAKPMVPVQPVKPPPPKVEIKTEPFAETQVCHACGALSSKILSKCPKCGKPFASGEPQAKPAPPPNGTVKAQYAEDALLALGEIEKQARVRERKLRSEKITPAPVAAKASQREMSKGVEQANGRVNGRTNGMTNGRTNGRVNGRTNGMTNGRVNGRINGVSKINGVGAVNGRGAVNGTSLVNGTGVSNGLRSRARASASSRKSFVTRWQFLAVLVAIAIVIPTFVYLSYSKKPDEFAADGDFDEWSDVTTYGTKIYSASSRTNITEWAVSSDSTELFFYFRTQSLMMSSSEADSFYLFVDSDGSTSTGYAMDTLGADFKLQLTGWEGAVSSTSICRYQSATDQYNWSAWTDAGPFTCSLDGVRLEAEAALPVTIGQSAKFMLVSKDSAERSSVSHVAPAMGGVLIVEQMQSDGFPEDGIVPKSGSVSILSVRVRCEGQGGQVNQITPSLSGAVLSTQIQPFSIDVGDSVEFDVIVSTLSAADGQLVSAEILESDISSSFASVEILGCCVSAYVAASPSEIEIDGAFADWEGRLSYDQDSFQISDSDVDIDDVGNVSTVDDSFFYVSVAGEMCRGSFVPALVVRPSGSGGGGGTVISARHTAEDILSILVDSDRSNLTGEWVALGDLQIGADQKIEVRGMFGRITDSAVYAYSSGAWIQVSDDVEASKDLRRIEVGVSSASLGGSSDFDFIVQTTTWRGIGDYATYDPSTLRSMTRSWVVDTSTTSKYATSMSYQRKVFYDGTNYWSFFFDGSNTVHKYSTDGGSTWTSSGSVFTTSGVNETSLWYDPSTHTVYVVGDTSSASTSVYIQTGTVDSAGHSISWAASDSTLAASSSALGGKNTYICKDVSGYLWILSSNCTQPSPARYQLTAFKSSSVNSTSAWTSTGGMLSPVATTDNLKGSILPAGTGSDVWAVYATGGTTGTLAARKYNGAWQAQDVIYTSATLPNVDSSPPSVVVDSKGVVHVVYGNGRKVDKLSAPEIEYSHNETGLTTFTDGVSLDQYIGSSVGDYSPTVSIDAATDNLYVFWLQSDSSLTPKTVVGRLCSAGSWSNLTLSSDTTYAKQYLTSIYSVSGAQNICWEWSQNTTADYEVIFDKIPEFGEITIPIIGMMTIMAVSWCRRRRTI